MTMPGWLKATLTVAGDIGASILGGFLGAELSEKEEKGKKSEIARKFGEKVYEWFFPEREEVLNELLLLGDRGKTIRTLLLRANRNKYIELDGRRYYENWIVNMLLAVKKEDRFWVYPILNRVLLLNEAQFFTLLEILNNDGYLRFLERVWEIAEQVAQWLGPAAIKAAEKTIATLAGERDIKKVNRRLARYANQLHKKSRRSLWGI